MSSFSFEDLAKLSALVSSSNISCCNANIVYLADTASSLPPLKHMIGANSYSSYDTHVHQPSIAISNTSGIPIQTQLIRLNWVHFKLSFYRKTLYYVPSFMAERDGYLTSISHFRSYSKTYRPKIVDLAFVNLSKFLFLLLPKSS